jgi:hypothetical protein
MKLLVMPQVDLNGLLRPPNKWSFNPSGKAQHRTHPRLLEPYMASRTLAAGAE